MIRSRPGIATAVAVAVLLASTVVASASAADQVKVDVAFSGLWWTEKQVHKFGEEVAEGIERTGKQVDIPLPPKETRTVIKKWDFGGDDMMPPHPDVVDVDVTVSASVSVKEPVEISYQYEEKGRRTAPVTRVRSVRDLAPVQAKCCMAQSIWMTTSNTDIFRTSSESRRESASGHQ